MRLLEIQSHWKKSLNALNSAKSLFREGYLEDAISRAYYSVFHAAKAALLVHDIPVTKSHRAVRNYFGQILINSGEIEKEWGRILSLEYDLRTSADYNELFWAESEHADRLIKNAEGFLKRMEE